MESPINITTLKKTPPKLSRFSFRLSNEDMLNMAKAAEALGIEPPDFVRRAVRELSSSVLAAAEKPKPPRKKKS